MRSAWASGLHLRSCTDGTCSVGDARQGYNTLYLTKRTHPWRIRTQGDATPGFCGKQTGFACMPPGVGVAIVGRTPRRPAAPGIWNDDATDMPPGGAPGGWRIGPERQLAGGLADLAVCPRASGLLPPRAGAALPADPALPPGPGLARPSPPALWAHAPRTAGAQLVRSPRPRRPGRALGPSMRGHPWPTRLTTRDPTRAFAPVKAPGCAGANAREFPWPTRSAARAPKLRRRRAPDTRNRRAPSRKTASASGSPRWSCGRPGWPARSPGPGPDTAPPRRTPCTPVLCWRYRP